MKKAQSTIEYLLIIAVVLIIVVLVVLFLSGFFGKSGTDAQLASCKQAASTCDKNKVFYGKSYDCYDICYESCISTNTGLDVMTNKTTDCYSAYNDKFDGSGCGYCTEGLMADIK